MITSLDHFATVPILARPFLVCGQKNIDKKRDIPGGGRTHDIRITELGIQEPKVISYKNDALTTAPQEFLFGIMDEVFIYSWRELEQS